MLVFEWDDEKDWSNFLKHGLFFEEAKVIWADERAIDFFDEIHSNQEDRFLRVGLNPMRGILIVAYCEREQDIIRIISARKAISEERREYERQIRLNKT